MSDILGFIIFVILGIIIITTMIILTKIFLFFLPLIIAISLYKFFTISTRNNIGDQQEITYQPYKNSVPHMNFFKNKEKEHIFRNGNYVPQDNSQEQYFDNSETVTTVLKKTVAFTTYDTGHAVIDISNYPAGTRIIINKKEYNESSIMTAYVKDNNSGYVVSALVTPDDIIM